MKHPVFGRLFAAQCVALVGTGLLTVALGLLAYDLAGAAAASVLGTAYAIKMVAYVGLSPVMGALVARLPRKPVLIGADVIRAAVALALPFITEIWQIYLAIFALQTASATFTPAFQATIPDVLSDEDDYAKALSLSRLAYDLENLLSPALAGLLLLIMSFHGLFVGTAAGFLASALLIQAAALPAPQPSKDRPFCERLTRGVSIYLATPRLRGLLALVLPAAAGSAFVIVNTVVVVQSGYGGDATDVAIALAAFGGGSMVAAFLLPAALRKLGDRRVMMTAASAHTASLIGYALLQSLPWAAYLLLWALLGLTYAAIVTPSGRLLRRSAHSDDRAAVFTAHFALSHLCWLVTYPVAGWGMNTFGPAATLTALAAIGATGLIIARAVWPADDPAVLTHDHPELPPDHPHLAGDGRTHAHRFVIDDAHRHWPTHG